MPLWITLWAKLLASFSVQFVLAFPINVVFCYRFSLQPCLGMVVACSMRNTSQIFALAALVPYWMEFLGERGGAVGSSMVVLALLPTDGDTVASTEKFNVCLASVLTKCTSVLFWTKPASAASRQGMKQKPYGAQFLLKHERAWFSRANHL